MPGEILILIPNLSHLRRDSPLQRVVIHEEGLGPEEWLLEWLDSWPYVVTTIHGGSLFQIWRWVAGAREAGEGRKQGWAQWV
ncbi:hypothetical protein L484_022718 [Morus notabilis]|uniref:Uncharacterized protein n=1 Tax=Morus notabilis TaxID=981085 RepID=W9SCH6_9ROSA|nr:hypothetical protein L484_022718 [Morus notabilis]